MRETGDKNPFYKNKSYASYREEKLREIAEDKILIEMVDAETEERIKKLD